MPNHVTNILKSSSLVLDALKSEKDLIDFSTIIPMPESVLNTNSNGDDRLVDLLNGKIDFSTKSNDLSGNLRLSNLLCDLNSGGISKWPLDRFENLVRMLRNFRDHGASTWYDFACERWGTKWNAYSIEKLCDGVKFETAWSAPHPVIRKLAGKFPDEKIEHEWADEDIGKNLGKRTYQFGKVANWSIEDPIDFALTLNEDNRKYYKKNAVSRKWEYNESLEES